MSDTELSPPPPTATLKAGNAGAATTAAGGVVDGDWTCEDCSNVNFAWRSACYRCGKARANAPETQRCGGGGACSKKKLGQEIGKQAAEKSRGLFSADDWQCNKCGNVNWARRQQCNVCNAPKFGEVEERTGFGGGYNDRGVVEYKERVDSDDEYDEFGRRRRRSARDNGTSTSKNNHKIADNEVKHTKPAKLDELEDEEDDDDDEDDGDLSKYDLSDWGDVTAQAQNNTAHARNPHERRRSRSRSRSRTKQRSRSRSPIVKKYT